MPLRRRLLAIVLAAPGIGWCQSLSPGLWEISVQASSADVAAPLQVSQCLTAEDARDPSRILGPAATPGASGCVYRDRSYSGSTFRFAMECGGTFALKANGEVSFTSTSLTGTIHTAATISGQPIEMNPAVSARRMGDCAASR